MQEIHVLKYRLVNTPEGAVALCPTLENEYGDIIQIDPYPVSLVAESREDLMANLEQFTRILKTQPIPQDVDFEEEYTPDLVDMIQGGVIPEED